MLKYIGKGFLPDVPSRDLTDVEAAMYGKEMLLASGLYVDESASARKGKKNLTENVKHSDLESEEV